ncbi:beta-1,3-galactosyltransferase 5-like [Uloborus diversus]|uniref:beta-1,3-galactosyltransferase 5-like n=1 Tax=Uloborus diversus TaxID=327109 RepID=UPI0024091508|nr:beta-1,3-galactosyltransferase 5-like [Uloborus diversus]
MIFHTFHWPLRIKKVVIIPAILIICGLSIVLRNPREEDLFLNYEIVNENTVEKYPVITSPLFSKVGEFVFLPNTAGPCRSKSGKILVLVHSSPAHVAHRSAIRRTWGKSDFRLNTNLRTVFIVGQSGVPMIEKRIMQEAKTHGDIVLIKLIDSYRNMTLKHLAGLKWAIKNCPDIQYVMKVDDDAFVDMKRVTDKLESSPPSKNSLMCQTIPDGSSPRRTGKWGVTADEYPRNSYPEYCSGLAYLTKSKTLSKLYDAAMFGRVPYLWIDDVFVTGLVAEFAQIRRVDMSVWFADNELQVVEWMKNGTGTCPWMIAEMSFRHWPADASRLWRKSKMAWIESTVAMGGKTWVYSPE